MNNVVVARIGEIHLKGNNKGLFLKRLLKNLGGSARYENERILCDDIEKAVQTFGITSASVANIVSSSPDEILEYLKSCKISGTFKVEVNRADKKFPIKSPVFAPMCGGIILDKNPLASVDVHNPETVIYIDIRIDKTYIYDSVVMGVGGLPVGVSGRAIVLLSGGIDSPVAAWLAAKRGLAIDFVHFATPPYTNDLALDKVRKLQSKLEPFIGKSRLFVVPITDITLAIRKHCSPEFMITLMRRFMVRTAEQLGINIGADCIITGENLAQVASQTILGIASNNFCATRLPILRPLITFDKSEIIALSKRIGTFETSIVPHEDCCTIFVPRNPIINPKINQVLEQEEKLDVETLIKNALSNIT